MKCGRVLGSEPASRRAGGGAVLLRFRSLVDSIAGYVAGIVDTRQLNKVRYTLRDCYLLFSEQELQLIRTIIADDPSRHRFALSQVVCERLHWRRANGQLKDMSCRVAMLRILQRFTGSAFVRPLRNHLSCVHSTLIHRESLNGINGIGTSDKRSC